jgi:hypothetical protein
MFNVLPALPDLMNASGRERRVSCVLLIGAAVDGSVFVLKPLLGCLQRQPDAVNYGIASMISRVRVGVCFRQDNADTTRELADE